MAWQLLFLGIGSSSKVPEGDLLYCTFVLYVGAKIISGSKEYQGNDVV